ncbi:MAG: PAS domain S-box protein, partial [Proteobacteria bacterium]|nr:PAS domain S-box protein [Pseudomonadota bacterium]
DKNGKPLRLFGSIQDVTAAKLAEIELREALATLHSTTKLLEQTGKLAKVGGWELDVATGKVEMSKETQRLHEMDGSYVPPLYDTGAQWYPAENWPTIQAAVQAAIELGKPYDLESPFITAKGRHIWVRVQGFPVTVAGKVTHVQGTFQDISERKLKELEGKFGLEI